MSIHQSIALSIQKESSAFDDSRYDHPRKTRCFNSSQFFCFFFAERTPHRVEEPRPLSPERHVPVAALAQDLLVHVRQHPGAELLVLVRQVSTPLGLPYQWQLREVLVVLVALWFIGSLVEGVSE